MIHSFHNTTTGAGPRWEVRYGLVFPLFGESLEQKIGEATLTITPYRSGTKTVYLFQFEHEVLLPLSPRKSRTALSSAWVVQVGTARLPELNPYRYWIGFDSIQNQSNAGVYNLAFMAHPFRTTNCKRCVCSVGTLNFKRRSPVYSLLLSSYDVPVNHA